MQWRNDSSRYGWLSVSLHWVMLALLITVYVSIRRGNSASHRKESFHN